MIRAMTFNILRNFKDLSTIKSMINHVINIIKKFNLNVWSWRITLSNDIPWTSVVDLCNDYLINAYHKHVELVEIDDLAQYLTTCRNGYAAIFLEKPERVDTAARILYKLYEAVGEKAMTRVGISLGGPIETPYYPLSTALRSGVSVSLRYVDLIYGVGSDKWFDTISSYICKLRDKLINMLTSLNMSFIGLDISLSPWINEKESIIEVIESASGVKFPSTGTAHIISKLNSILTNVMNSCKGPYVGFNEIMLPLAEDKALIERAREGVVRLRDMVNLSMYCIAGLDMVPVEHSYETIINILKDMVAVYSIKRRVVGVRIIPTTSSEVRLEPYGNIPVLRD